MENYEKKYRHAIEVVKKYSGAHIMLTEDLIGEMFPELIENNDEKIRTELIRLVSDWSDDGRASTCGYLTSIPKKDILDWLERQKSLFPDNEKRDVWEYVEKFKENYGHYPKDADEMGVIVSEIVNKHNKPIVFEGKDQGRYEDIRDILRELINNDKYTRSAIECDLKWFTERFRYMKPQPKQEWSEEDENMLKSVIATCELAEQDRDSSPAKHLLEMQTNWLKSLKDRVQPQQKREWSKEDEDVISKTESWLDTLCYYLDTSPEYIPDIKDVINKLKSLRPKNTWKPSEEQMFALNIAIEMEDGDILKSLYNDLKQL